MSNYSDLPQELLEEILQRLPHKSLSRFRFVCKFWYSLLTGPLFIPSHLSNSVLLSLSFDPSSLGSYEYKLFSLSSNNDSSSVICTPLPRLWPLHTRFRISGHSNGILCLSVGSWVKDMKFALYNPTTKEFKNLPKSFLQAMNSSSYQFSCGMGYDPQRGDYKVVRIWFKYGNTVVEEYSLRTDSWTTSDNSNAIDFIFHSASFALFFKGTYYWWATRRGHGYSSALILGLSMGEDIFGPVTLSQEVDMSKPRNLVVWRESVTLICCCEIRGLNLSWIDIWVMDNNNRFGSEADQLISWSKTHSIAPNGLLEDPKPLVFWKGNELLLKTFGGEIKPYNVDSGEIQNLEIKRHSAALATNFVATLVKIKGVLTLMMMMNANAPAQYCFNKLKEVEIGDLIICILCECV